MKKKAVIIALVLAAIILLFPVRIQYKDGGSVEYRSLTYSVTHYHRISLDNPQGFDTGWKIKVFGLTVRDDIK